MKKYTLFFLSGTLFLASCKMKYTSSFSPSGNPALPKQQEVLYSSIKTMEPEENSAVYDPAVVGHKKGREGVGRADSIGLTKMEVNDFSVAKMDSLKKDSEKKERPKKVVNPRLSRALWMTIPGGLMVVLGILLYGVAPTGLFIFAFSLVFLVGIISLIQYWINPKPKM